MVNSVFVDDKKMRDILTYISGMKHAKKIRMMFLCSHNGMRDRKSTRLNSSHSH